MLLIGVDGCRAGWVSATTEIPAEIGRPLATPSFRIWRTFGALLEALVGERAVIAVDIPIGLPTGAPPDNGRRRADAEARRFLGGRRAASVFSAPCRSTLAAVSYQQACLFEREARGGKGLSQQAYGILPKIREVDAAIGPAHQAEIDDSVRVWVREVHPEVVFAALDGQGERGFGLAHPKRGCVLCRITPCDDADVRLTLLAQQVASFDPDATRLQLIQSFREDGAQPDVSPFKGVPVGRDDIVDAVACLVSARRIVSGEARTLPEGEPQRDARGLRMEILA